MKPNISGFCNRRALAMHDDVFLFHTSERDYAVLDTPIMDNGVFMVVTDEEWEAHGMIMKPTKIETPYCPTCGVGPDETHVLGCADDVGRVTDGI